MSISSDEAIISPVAEEHLGYKAGLKYTKCL